MYFSKYQRGSVKISVPFSLSSPCGMQKLFFTRRLQLANKQVAELDDLIVMLQADRSAAGNAGKLRLFDDRPLPSA